jgi:hypothetical protein
MSDGLSPLPAFASRAGYSWHSPVEEEVLKSCDVATLVGTFYLSELQI